MQILSPTNRRAVVVSILLAIFSCAPAGAEENPASTGSPGAASPGAPASKSALSGEARELLMAAGNAGSDAERLALLQRLRERSDLSEPFRQDLDRMIKYVNLWVNNYELSKHSDKYMVVIRRVPKLKEYSPSSSEEPLLKAMMSMYLGRIRVYNIIQQNQKYKALSPDERKNHIEELLKPSQSALKAFPENPIIKMFSGHPIPWPKELDVPADPGAPEWANLQREGLEKLAQVAHWWAQVQKPEGFFGTGWGDDCEMWRVLVPVTVAFDDPELTDSQRKLSEGIFAQDYMAKGFSSNMSDAEHVSEDSSDAITPMLCMAPDD